MHNASKTKSLDVERLLGFNIPEVCHTVSPRDAILYALSVGFGQDPVDERQLRYVFEGRGLEVVPSAAVVLGHPGFWIADPRTGVDPSSVLHGEQEILLEGPLPFEGQVTGRTRVTGIVDKGAGKAALVLSEKQLADAETGKLLATTRMTQFLRGHGGFGGSAAPLQTPHRLPDRQPDMIVDIATRPEQALLYRLNGDPNPLHADPAFAREAGFPRPILHGLCTFGIVCHALLASLADYRAERLRAMRLRFSAPIFPGETIRTEVWACGSFRVRVLERDLVVADNGLAEFR